MTKPLNIILVGMPRSGTSMTTSIFAGKGYFVAEDEEKHLRQGDEYNPSGYWEAEPLIECNAEIFNAAGYPHDNTWLYEPINADQSRAILALDPAKKHADLIQRYNRNMPWIWKDPRLCYTLGYWWPLMDQKNTRVLLLTRKPDEIHQSFIRLHWRSRSKSDKLDVYERIEDHINAARTAIDKYDIPFIEVDYSDFELAPEKTMRNLAGFFSLELSVNDLPYSSRLNRSNPVGKLSTLIDHIFRHVPDGPRKLTKGLVPKPVYDFFFPYRKR